MSEEQAYAARPHNELIAELLDSRVPKAEREHAAAREIERLRLLLARYRDEVPLGHQPHMIAHEVDGALSRRD